MDIEVAYLTAVLAGMLSFLSPCVLPLVPPYLCYMAGVSVDEFRERTELSSILTLAFTSVFFVLGFSSVFILLGAGASTIGHLLRVWQEPLAIAAGIIIIVMGLNFLGIIRIPLLSREARFQTAGKPANIFAAYLMGLAFAFGWTPCIGPILGPILTLAGKHDTAGEGALLLATYSMGLGLPFLLAALFSGLFMRFLVAFRVHLGRVEKVIGALLVIAGLLFITGGMTAFSYWLLERFPALGNLG